MKKLYQMCLTLLAVTLVSIAPAAAGSDPLEAILKSLHLGSQARIAVIADRRSCEAGELAGMMHMPRVVSIERDDLAGPVSARPCGGTASVQRVIWPSSPSSDAALPVQQLDLIWMAGGYHQLYANLPAPRMAKITRALAAAVGSHGTLVIADKLAPSAADPVMAAREGMMDPQIVLNQLEAAGLRLQSFANDAASTPVGRTSQTAHRFVMVFKNSDTGSQR